METSQKLAKAARRRHFKEIRYFGGPLFPWSLVCSYKGGWSWRSRSRSHPRSHSRSPTLSALYSVFIFWLDFL